MTITLTQNAASHISEMLQQRGQGIGLRLDVKTYGCSGYGYVVDYADTVTESDSVFETHGAKVVVDKNKLELIDGLVIDFVKNDALNEGFEFHNPKAKDSCGCGESFSV